MKSIYACKLFKGSKNQSAIRAAISDPINRELVLQLNRYLDEDDLEEIAEEQVADHVEDHQVAESDPVQDVEIVDDSEIKKTSEIPDESRIVHIGNIQQSDSAEEPVEDEVVDHNEDEPVVESNTNVEDIVVASDDTAAPSLDTVQGTLNAVEETSGVVRTRTIDDELWVYYNDKKNLNNLMGAVIESLNAAGYYQLEFNRLARTENAIVFQVTNTSTEVYNGET